MRLFFAGVFMALILAICFYADASRNASGTYTTPNTFVSGTVISSTNVNANFSDIATELTDSLSRSGKGGMSAALRGTDGTKAAPAMSFTSETGSGLYRNGSADVRLSVTGTDVVDYATTGITVPGNVTLSGASSVLSLTGATAPKIGIGGAPTNMLDLTVPGSASTTVGQWLEASLGDGNSLTTYYGKSLGSGLAGILTYTKNATAVNSKLCLGVFGGAVDTACVDGNNKFYIGSTGTAISASYRGTTSWTPGVVGTNACVTTTITVTGAAAGADCVVTIPSGTPVASIWTACSVTLNTCNLYDCNADNVNTHIGLIGTYACRVFNP